MKNQIKKRTGNTVVTQKKGKNKTMRSFRLDEKTYQKAQHIAQQQNCTVTNYIETVLKEKIREYETQHGEIETTSLN